VQLRLAPRASVSARELSAAFVQQLLPTVKATLRKRLRLRAAKKIVDAIGRGELVGRSGDDEGGGGAGQGTAADDGANGTGSGGEDAADVDDEDAKAASRAALRGEGAADDDDDQDATLQLSRLVATPVGEEAEGDVGKWKRKRRAATATGAGSSDSGEEGDEGDADEGDEGDEGNEGDEGDEDEEMATPFSDARRLGGRTPPAGGSSAPVQAEWLAAARSQLVDGMSALVDFGEEPAAGGAAHASSLWLEVELPLRGERLLLVPLVETAVSHVLVRATPGIASAVVVPEGKGHSLPTVMTSGVNFSALANLAREVDLNAVVSNDVYAVLKFYGVEAARATIVSEIKSVFGVYGISVDPRHLGLIADYMTHEGAYQPLNRNGMESCASPLLQMSFETTMNFLEKATLHGVSDPLTSPSASIVLGKPPNVGTGAFELHAQLPRSTT